MTPDPTPVNETPRDEMEIQRKDDLIVEFRKQLKANIRAVEQQQANQRIRQGALADALGVPRNDAPSSYYTNIEAVDILRKDLGRARRDLERVTQLYDASLKVLVAHVDAVRAAEVYCHLEHSPAQAGTEDTAQPGGGDAEAWRQNRAQGWFRDVGYGLQKVLGEHRYLDVQRGSKQDDPGWHPCTCGWEGYWSAFHPHVADHLRMSVAAAGLLAAPSATEAKGQDADSGNQLVTIFCPNCSTLMTVAEHENHDCRPATSEGTGEAP